MNHYFIYIGRKFHSVLGWTYSFDKTERNYRRFGILINWVLFPTIIFTVAYFIWVDHICRYSEYFWLKEVYWHWAGIYYGVVGIAIGFYVYVELANKFARNPEEFLALFNKIIRESKKDDKLFFLSPSFVIEKAKNKDSFETYKTSIISKLVQGVKVTFAVLKTDPSQLSNFVNLEQEAKTDLITSNFNNDSLVKFHLSFPNVKSNADEYLIDLSDFFHQLKSHGCEFIWLKDEYDLHSKTLVVANRTKAIFYTGNYFRINKSKPNETLSINVNEMEERLEMNEIIEDLLKTFEI